MTEKLEPKQYATEMARRMKEIIEEGKDALPMTFAVDFDNKVILIATPFSGEDQGERAKDGAAIMMRMVANQPETRFVVFMSDSWVKTVEPNESVDASKGLKNVPGRTEAIVITVFGKEIGREPMMGTWNYGRDSANKPVFEPEIQWVDMTKMGAEGRFVPGGRGRAQA